MIISLTNEHIEIPSIEQAVKKAQQKIKKYLQPETDLVEMLFNERKEDVENE